MSVRSRQIMDGGATRGAAINYAKLLYHAADRDLRDTPEGKAVFAMFKMSCIEAFSGERAASRWLFSPDWDHWVTIMGIDPDYSRKIYQYVMKEEDKNVA